MFKLEIKRGSIDKIEANVRKKLEKLRRDPALLNELGDTIIKDIQFSTRRGKNPRTGDSFKPLTEDWKDRRGEIAKSNIVHDTYSRSRSNLALTGQLLDSMKNQIKNTKLFIIFFGDHQPYKIKRKLSSGTYDLGKKIPNADLATYVQKDRPFMEVRPSLIPRLKTIVNKFIRRNI